MCNFVRFEPCSEITLSLCNANKYMNKISTSTAEYELKNRKFTPCSDVGQTVHPTHSNYLVRVLILYDFLESQSKYH